MPLRTFLIVKIVLKINVELIFNGEMDSGVKNGIYCDADVLYLSSS